MSADAPKILIVYASQSGGTTRLVEAVERGAAREEHVQLRRRHGTEATLEDLLWCDALVVATPENFGYMAGALKDFFDRTFYPAEGKVGGLPYAVVIRAGNDGSFALSAVQRIATGYGFKQVAEPILWVGDAVEPIDACEELGQTLAASLAFGLYPRPS